LGLTECFGEHLGGHFSSKLASKMGDSIVCKPEHIIKLLMEMSDDNKEKYLEWIDNNYKYKPDYKSE
jgi:prenyltransferase beta subunit